MGRAKKRYIKLAQELRKEHPDWPSLRAYEKAIDLDQRQQAALQAARWRAADPLPRCDGTGCNSCGDCRICDCVHKYGCDRISVDRQIDEKESNANEDQIHPAWPPRDEQAQGHRPEW